MTRAKPPAEWQNEAACIPVGVEPFFPEPYDRGSEAEAAKAICADCPVLESCLEDALESRDDWAILGGTTPSERRAMRRKAGAA